VPRRRLSRGLPRTTTSFSGASTPRTAGISLGKTRVMAARTPIPPTSAQIPSATRGRLRDIQFVSQRNLEPRGPARLSIRVISPWQESWKRIEANGFDISDCRRRRSGFNAEQQHRRKPESEVGNYGSHNHSVQAERIRRR